MTTNQVNKIGTIQWLLPILFGILGGVLFWAINKEHDPANARLGLVLGVGLSIVSIALYALLALMTLLL